MAKVPETHQDLLSDAKRAYAYLATTLPDGSPQVTPVWFDVEGDLFRINTARGRVKDRNMTARPKVALLIHDPDDPFRYVLVRGEVVEAKEEGAREHIDRLSLKYLGKPFPWYREGDVRVTYIIRPRHVSVH